MTQLPNVNLANNNQAFGAANALNEVDLDDFLNLMIAELQNQDPLNPLENDELIAQISQIREVGATEQLTATLNAVLLGQNITSATNLIGADVVALNDALDRLAEQAPRKTQVVELRFFAGLSIDEAAEALGVSHTTVEKDWNFARAWLRHELGYEGDPP